MGNAFAKQSPDTSSKSELGQRQGLLQPWSHPVALLCRPFLTCGVLFSQHLQPTATLRTRGGEGWPAIHIDVGKEWKEVSSTKGRNPFLSLPFKSLLQEERTAFGLKTEVGFKSLCLPFQIIYPFIFLIFQDSMPLGASISYWGSLDEETFVPRQISGRYALFKGRIGGDVLCLLYTSPSPRD